jgi:hypothetical protein
MVTKQIPWPDFSSELYLPSERRLSAKLVPNLEDRWCHTNYIFTNYYVILFIDDNVRKKPKQYLLIILALLSNNLSTATRIQDGMEK